MAHWNISSSISDVKAAALADSLDTRRHGSSSVGSSDRQDASSSASSSPTSQASSTDAANDITPPSSAADEEDGDLCLGIPAVVGKEDAQTPLMPRFFELCINSGRNKKIVAEIDLTEMKTDAEFFIAIADRYRQSRNGRGYVAVQLPQFLGRYMRIRPFECCFMRPSDIVFRKVRYQLNSTIERNHLTYIMKFILYQHQSPEIAICNPGLPPKSEVRKEQYHYFPCPMELDEPMPAHEFFHVLDDPIPHTRDTWMQRLPKKLRTSLLSTRENESAPISWGVHITETPNWYIIFTTIFLLLLASGAFSITWAAVTKDVQGAFGMGAYVVAVLTAGMTALFFKCSEDR